MEYKITFKNSTGRLKHIYFEHGGPSGLVLMIDEELMIETSNPKTLYARYSLVQFLENGTVSLKIRKGWHEPEYRFPSTIFLNKDGGELEGISTSHADRAFGGFTIVLPRGIPNIVELPADSFYAKFKKYEKKIVKKMKQSRFYSHYRAPVEEVKWIGIERSKKEIEKLNQMIEERRQKEGEKHKVPQKSKVEKEGESVEELTQENIGFEEAMKEEVKK